MPEHVAARAACPVHPDREAAGVCARCGRFVCAECSGMTGMCPECQTLELRKLPDGASRARWAGYFLLANVVTDGLLILSSAIGVETRPTALLGVAAGLLTLVAFIGAAITYLRWLHLAVRATNAVGLRVGATPGWAVGYFFVPIVNLFRPYQVVNTMAAVLGGEAMVAPVGWWWAAWIAGNIITQIDSRVSPTGFTVLGVVGNLLSIAAAFLCIRVIRAIQRELDARRARGGALP